MTFTLKEKPGTDGEALIPTEIRAEASTNKRFENSSVKAVRKWLFLSRKASLDQRYYVNIVYELE